MNTNNHISQLIKRYMAGETTCAEEQELREYFRTTADLPTGWQPLKALFAYVDEERMTISPYAIKPAKHRGERLARRLWLGAASAAASVIVLLAVGLWPKASNGCYAVIDGKRTTNAALVKSEADEALQLVAISDEDAFAALEEFD